MANAGLLGPARLTVDEIDRELDEGVKGAFAVGHIDFQNRFVVNSIGRADADLRDRLRQLVGTESHFKYRIFETTKEAFEKECELFHDFRPPGNNLHPTRPVGTTWQCPRCLSLWRRS